MPFNPRIRKDPKRKKPIILVTNDDGIHFESIHILAKKLSKVGRVIVVAPEQECSAVSHMLTLYRPLRVNKISANVYSVDGTPTDCVNIGVNEILKQKPDLVVSGINKGPNLGDDLHYSGTVSAALEGGILGIPSIAISVAAWEKFNFQPAASFAAKLARKVLKEGLPEDTVLNVNVPNVPLKKIRGYKFTIQGRIDYGNIIVQRLVPRQRVYYWLCGDKLKYENIPGSDCEAIKKNMISITPINVSMTSYEALEKLRSWKI